MTGAFPFSVPSKICAVQSASHAVPNTGHRAPGLASRLIISRSGSVDVLTLPGRWQQYTEWQSSSMGYEGQVNRGGSRVQFELVPRCS